MDLTLSQLINGQTFKFLPNQTTWWLLNNGQGPNGREYVTNGFTHFVVIKKNEKSVKVKPVDGRVEYIFRFTGKINNDTVTCVDPKIILIKNEK